MGRMGRAGTPPTIILASTRVFERGNEKEILEVIRFYGRDVILDNINLKVKSPFENNIKANIKQYLDYEA